MKKLKRLYTMFLRLYLNVEIFRLHYYLYVLILHILPGIKKTIASHLLRAYAVLSIDVIRR